MFGPRERIQLSFLFIAGDREEEYVVCVANDRLFFRLDTTTASSEADYLFLQYKECALALDVEDTKMDYGCLRWNTTDNECNYTVVAGE